MIIGPTAHAAVTMIDSKKGSMTNRAECAKEHFKNDLKYGAAIAVPAAGVAGAAVYAGLKPNTKVSKGLINIAQKTAKKKGIKKSGCFQEKWFHKINVLTNSGDLAGRRRVPRRQRLGSCCARASSYD